MTQEKAPVVMVVDDDPLLLSTIGPILELEGFEVQLCSDGRRAVDEFNGNIYTIVLDINMPEMSGLDVFQEIKEKNPLIPIILYTGLGGSKRREGIRREYRPHAYILKGEDPEMLIDTVVGAVECYTNILKATELNTALELKEQENINLREELGKRGRFEDIYTKDPKMLAIIGQARKSCEVPYAVLITGESGTGKELLAKAIHYNSPRATKPFVVLNCAAISSELVESELFGHEEGSFTSATRRKPGLFEVANEGSIFLDEIGDLGISAQAKILRVLQEKEFLRVGGTEPIKVDVRVLVATNKNLSEEVKKKNFREDLFYRLNAISIHLPPLRERFSEDISLLADHFLKKSSQEVKKRIRDISPSCMDLLERYDWPGNVRELQNVIERVVTWAENDSVITEDYLPPELKAQKFISIPRHSKGTKRLALATQAVEKDAIASTLKATRGNKSKAAEILGISRPLLYKKLELYGLTKPAQGS